MELNNISYEQACENFKDRIEYIPHEKDILPEFINENISDFIMAGKPEQEKNIPQREKDKRCASVLLGKAINNVQYIIQDQGNKLLTTLSEKKIILSGDIKQQREKDISTLQSPSKSYESKKIALNNFERIVERYIPQGREILKRYKNEITHKISLQKITNDLESSTSSFSLLREEILDKIQ